MNKTPIILHLHTHMPYVLNHGEWPHGNAWLSEVVFESYLPLLEMMNNLHRDGIKARLSFDFTPILLDQLEHHDAKNIFKRYAKSQLSQAESDIQKFSRYPDARYNLGMGEYWHEFYRKQLECFEKSYDYSIISGFRTAESLGHIETMTSGLTHAYLPLLESRNSTRMQIKAAKTMHQRLMGKSSRYIFLPECGYAPCMNDISGEYFLEDILLEESFDMIFLDQQHQMEYSDDSISQLQESLRPLLPIQIPRLYAGKNLRALIRHKTACDKVWSQESGYPTHSEYLDFHKKEFDSSLRYWKVTNHESGSDFKYPYSPVDASSQALLDAQDYISYLEQLALNHRGTKVDNGVICLAFDTELFGHWWFEGPQFLEYFIRGIQHSEILELTLPSEMRLNEHERIARSSAGSWGMNGKDETWRNVHTSWLLSKMHEAERQFESALSTCMHDDIVQVRVLNQALRELLLLQASDWPFLITRNQAVDYSESRFNQHHEYFGILLRLYKNLQSAVALTDEEMSILKQIESTDDILQDITIEQWINH